jgi:glycosyltransferase involved in cell wall biosynthesis
MMRILLIAYSFPPFQDAQSLRWYYLANCLAELGVKIDVVSISHPNENAGHWKFHENIQVYRVFAGFVENLFLKSKNRLKVDERGNQVLRKTAKFKLMKSLYQGGRKFAGNVLPGDIRTEWFIFAARFLDKLLEKGSYSYVITSHEPWVDSHLGLYLMRKNRSFRWVADFGDPYVAPYTPLHKLWFENILEKAIYSRADALIFTNHNVVTFLEKKYPFLCHKKKLVLEQGFSFASCSEDSSKRNNVFTLTYTGAFYRNFRNPLNLINALCSAKFEYKFLLVGRNEAFVRDFSVLGERFEFLGVMDHFAALRLQRDSDVLINMGNKDCTQVPGKMYEYLGALRPILSITYTADDPGVKLMEEVGCGVSCMNDSLAILNALERLHFGWKNHVGITTTCGDIYKYSWENKARMLFDYLIEN